MASSEEPTPLVQVAPALAISDTTIDITDTTVDILDTPVDPLANPVDLPEDNPMEIPDIKVVDELPESPGMAAVVVEPTGGEGEVTLSVESPAVDMLETPGLEIPGTPPSGKRKRHSYTIEQKKAILQLREEGPKLRMGELKNLIAQNLGFHVAAGTLHGILKDERIKNEEGDRKRLRRARYPKLESDVMAWINAMNQSGTHVADDAIKAKIRELCPLMDPPIDLETFKVSSGWLSRFKRRGKLIAGKQLEEGAGVEDGPTELGALLNAAPSPPRLNCGVIAHSHTMHLDIPVLSADEVHAALLALPPHPRSSSYRAFYSSVIGGITCDPPLMQLPIDDHMVHRGHGVFDTALIWDGFLYEIDPHVDRLLRSAEMAKIPLPGTREQIREILIQTAAAGNVARGSIQYWISAGTGGFGLSTKECDRSHLYAIVLENRGMGEPPKGIKVITSSVAIKPPEFARMKSVCYLPNALVLHEAEEFVTAQGELLVPDFDPILAGCTMRRVMRLAEHLLAPPPQSPPLEIGEEGSKEVTVVEEEEGAGGGEGGGMLKSIRIGKVTVEEAREAVEMMVCSSALLIEPVLQWDDQMIGTGYPGVVTMSLRALLEEDLNGAPEPHRVPVPIPLKHED